MVLTKIVLAILTFVFLWESFSAFLKLLEYDIGQTSRRVDGGNDPALYPTVVLCKTDFIPVSALGPRNARSMQNKANIFLEAMELRPQIELTRVLHGNSNLLHNITRAESRGVFGDFFVSNRGVLSRCVTINSPLSNKTSSQDTLSLEVKTRGDTDISMYYGSIIDQRTYLPMKNNLFGSDYFYFKPPPDNGTQRTVLFDILKVRKIFLTTPNCPCLHEDDPRPHLSDCIVNFTEHELGCRLPFNRLFKSSFGNNCSTVEQYMHWREILKSLESATEDFLGRLTGCRPRCGQNHYQLVKKLEDLNLLPEDPQAGDVRISFGMFHSQFEVREDIHLYSVESFIAEVGGFLGLLLGASIFTMFQGLKNYLMRTKCYAKHFAPDPRESRRSRWRQCLCLPWRWCCQRSRDNESGSRNSGKVESQEDAHSKAKTRPGRAFVC